MTLVSRPLYLQNDGPSAEQHRDHLTTAYGRRPGVMYEDDLAVSQRGAGANMSVDVADGHALVKGGESTYQGLYLCYNQGVENVAIATSDPTNARKDLVCLRVRDSAESGASDDATFFVVEGTPDASPVPDTASIPDNAVVLALVDVAAAATTITSGNITDLRKLDTYGDNDNGTAVLPSGLILCTSTDRPLDELYEGMLIYETDTGDVYKYTNTAWSRLAGDAEGTITTFTPTVTSGLTIGNGTASGKYSVQGKLLYWWIDFTMGSTSVMGTSPKFDVPGGLTLDGGSGSFQMVGAAVARDDTAGTFYSGVCYAGDSSDQVLTTRIIFNTATVTATAPFTWATTDSLWLSGVAVLA